MTITIDTDLYLTALKLSDAEALFRAVEQSRESLAPYMPWEKEVCDTVSARKYIDTRINSDLHGAEWFSIVYKDVFSGVFGVKLVDRKSQCCEMGYWLSDRARGNRIIGRVLPVLISRVAAKQNVNCVEFHCIESNIPSIRIVKSLGAVLAAKVKNTYDLPNSHQMLNIYRLEVDISK